MDESDIAARGGEGDIVAVEVPKELQTPSGMTGAIYSAIDAQRSAAISYVRNVRGRQLDATPAEIVKTLERHYLVSVTASGSAVGATAFIPGAGTAVALGAAAAELLLQFELAALFGLAIAEVHGLNITDRDRARTVILTLMLEQEGRSKVTALAKAAIRRDASGLTGAAQLGKGVSVDDLPLADLLGTAVPADLVPSILESVQDLAKKKLPETVAVAGTRLIPGGIGMVLGGFGGYAAGNDVVQASRQAFGPSPDVLPDWLEPVDSDGDGVPDPSALEIGMRAALGTFVETSGGIVGAAASGMSAAATKASRPFRSVDLDGDGVPDEAQALTAAKGVGRAAAGAAGALRERGASLFKPRPQAGQASSGGDVVTTDEN